MTKAVPVKAVQSVDSRESRVEKLLYSLKDAAYALSLSVRTVRYMVKGKHIVARRIGSRILIPATEVRRIARQDVPDFKG